MRAHLKRLTSQTLVYGIGDAVGRMVSLVLLPVYAHVLAPGEYGQIAVATLVSTLLGLILESGQRTAFFRLYFQTELIPERRRLTGTVVLYLLACACIVVPVALILLPSIAAVVFKDSSLVPVLRLALWTTFFELGSVVPFAIFRAEQRAATYTRLSIARMLCNTGFNLVAVLVLKWHVMGILWGNLVTSAGFFIVCLTLTARDIEWTMDRALLRRLLAFGLPLVPANAAGWVLTLSDRLFLERLGDLSQVGVYSVGYSIAGMLNMVMGWFNTAWAPYCMSVSNEEGARRLYARILSYAFGVFVFLGLAAGLASGIIVRVLTAPAYAAAARVVPWILLSYLFYELYYVLSLGFDLTGKTGYPALAICAAGLFNVILNMLLIPRYGMMGAAVATALSYAILPIVVYPIVQRLYPVPYELARLAKLLGVAGALFAAGSALRTGRPWVDGGVGLLLLAAFVPLLFVLRFFEAGEIAAAKSLRNGALAALRGAARRSSPTPRG